MTTGELQDALLEYIETYGPDAPVVLSAKDGWANLKHSRTGRAFVLDAWPAVCTCDAYHSAIQRLDDGCEARAAELEEKIRKVDELLRQLQTLSDWD